MEEVQVLIANLFGLWSVQCKQNVAVESIILYQLDEGLCNTLYTGTVVAKFWQELIFVEFVNALNVTKNVIFLSS